MKSSRLPMMDVQVVAKLADLTEQQYESGLLLSALLQLLTEKQVIRMEELQAMAVRLDAEFTPHPTLPIS
jgi:hypothetical protein